MLGSMATRVPTATAVLGRRPFYNAFDLVTERYGRGRRVLATNEVAVAPTDAGRRHPDDELFVCCEWFRHRSQVDGTYFLQPQRTHHCSLFRLRNGRDIASRLPSLVPRLPAMLSRAAPDAHVGMADYPHSPRDFLRLFNRGWERRAG